MEPHHNFATAYSPWANSTVDVVKRLILSVVNLRADEWHHLIPLVEGALNHLPSDMLGNEAPVTVFTVLLASMPLITFLHPRTKVVKNVDFLEGLRKKHVQELKAALDQLNRDVATSGTNKRAQARALNDKRRGVTLLTFTSGDFELVGHVCREPKKLTLNCQGPRKLLPPYGLSAHYIYRLKMYSEGGRELAEYLVEHIVFDDQGFHVAKLDGLRKVDG
ncbi:hypothetical protein H310_07968 [Aphanomyces invadans]|uniref:Integrase catalytic domain-containing protein n=1 Tax=Aphanomyces invadans TaxID=157072 RepID=A0A024U0M3_9STRA|nr:hypothetical protein H310_07968 [Aphanomyces invadans]ETV99950.1 hypothetical protein H310_07968 [Aphanomyces invadans]|eukprot:XP_008871726.1 hypothetical protein H310_07968 [Aphanomyces invadans]